MNAMNAPADAARRDKIGSASAGAVFVLLILTLAIFLPDPTPFQERRKKQYPDARKCP
jgi:hypothetical protein